MSNKAIVAISDSYFRLNSIAMRDTESALNSCAELFEGRKIIAQRILNTSEQQQVVQLLELFEQYNERIKEILVL